MKESEVANSVPLRPGEKIVVNLDGVVAGYTRWSGLGSVIGILVALTIPRVLHMSFLVGAATIVAVVTAVFLFVYYVVGRRVATKASPPMATPYVTVTLTNKRVLVFDRGLGGDEQQLVEAAAVRDIGTVRYGKASMLVPQRLGFVVEGTERCEFEFARTEPVRQFVEYFR